MDLMFAAVWFVVGFIISYLFTRSLVVSLAGGIVVLLVVYGVLSFNFDFSKLLGMISGGAPT